MMGFAAVAFKNLANIEANTLTVSGAVSTAPASNLRNPHVGKKCRVDADSTAIVLDLGSATSINAVAIAGVSGEPSFVVKGSTTDTSGADGGTFTSGSLSGTPYFDPNYGLFVYLRSAVSPRYLRIEVADAGVEYMDFGRLFVGTYNQFGINFAAPWSRTPVRASADTFGIGSQTFVDPRKGHYRVSCPFGFVSETEANGFLEDMAVEVVNNGHLDMLFIRDPESTNLSRDCIWGYHEGDWPRTQELYLDPPVFSVTFNVRSRG